MHTISFNSANYVARCVSFAMTGGWGEGDRTTNAYFAPIDTFEERFGEMLASIAAMGFTAVDLWQAHLNWTWSTPAHLAAARRQLDRHRLTVSSLAGGFGDTPEQFEAACRLAMGAGTRILGGSTGATERDRAAVVALLEQHDLVLGLENHPHLPTPDAMLAAIGDTAAGRIGTTVDTGWYGTVGVDAVDAIRQLAGHIVLVHLKDVLAAGAHDTCRYGAGIVPVEACVRELQRQGYRGPYSVEHEPERFDPTEDAIAGLTMLRSWLGEAAS